jgi:hypothetical protein
MAMMKASYSPASRWQRCAAARPEARHSDLTDPAARACMNAKACMPARVSGGRSA